MIIFLLEILCAFLISMSLVFVVIQIRARFDKSFLIFGISNLLLCSFCAIDIWLQPGGQELHWTRLQHILASFFPPFIVWHIMLVIKKENLNIVRILVLTSIVFALLFLTDVMLKCSENEVTSTFIYNFFFAPYLLATMLGLLGVTIFFLSKSVGYQKKTVIYHLIGEMFLYLGGALDLFIILKGNRFVSEIPNFSILGVLAFCLITTILFSDKLSSIVKEREVTFRKLREAYRELEDIQALKELGQSTAMINHEIRNYAVAISGYTELLQLNGDLNENAKKMVLRIGESVTRMVKYSKDILEFSKSRIFQNMVYVDLVAIVKNCINESFERNRDVFSVKNETPSEKIMIKGDWNKLDQVFINIFKNSLEASATKVLIKFHQTNLVYVCTILDNGCGCKDDDLEKIFKAFHTTKKEMGGTGLGMCVVNSIVERHGGRISAFSRKKTIKDIDGLGLQIIFPKNMDEISFDDEFKNDIIVVSDGLSNLTRVLEVFRNSFVKPYIFNTVKEINPELLKNKKLIVFGCAASIQQLRKINTLTSTCVIVENGKSGVFVLDERGETEPEQFSEYFVLSKTANVVSVIS
jgi:signal transduction histidine kinase